MLELLLAGGWLMILIILCSVVSVAICLERLYTLNPKKIAPPHLLATVWKELKAGELDAGKLRKLKESSPLGQILAAGLGNAFHGRDVMKESIQEAASHVIHDLERYLNTLGTIAAVAPLPVDFAAVMPLPADAVMPLPADFAPDAPLAADFAAASTTALPDAFCCLLFLASYCAFRFAGLATIFVCIKIKPVRVCKV